MRLILEGGALFHKQQFVLCHASDGAISLTSHHVLKMLLCCCQESPACSAGGHLCPSQQSVAVAEIYSRRHWIAVSR